VEEGCNPFIKSSVDKQNTENNLEVAARWCHLEIVRYLLDNIDNNPNLGGVWWSRDELEAAIRTEGVT
jgi:hypothetical protein